MPQVTQKTFAPFAHQHRQLMGDSLLPGHCLPRWRGGAGEDSEIVRQVVHTQVDQSQPVQQERMAGIKISTILKRCLHYFGATFDAT